jgi:zinc ribbon protein
MPEICSCGAQLPPDARFCHKCGKPQRDEILVAADEPVNFTPLAAVASPAEIAPMPLSFRNPIALRVGFFAAGLVCLLIMIPGLNYAAILWLLAAGYFSVWFYKRRTGQRLTVRSGARMGWITGVISFAMVTVLFTLTMLAVQQAGGLAVLKDQLRELSLQRGTVERAIQLLQNPYEILRSLVMMFFVMTLTCTAGGALGAKMLGKD